MDSVEQYFFTPDKNFIKSNALYISWAGKRICDASHNIGPRILYTYKLVFVISGQGYLIQDANETIHLTAGDIFVLFPNHLHHYWADASDPWVLCWAAFNGADAPYLVSSINITLEKYHLSNIINDSLSKKISALILQLADEEDIYRLGAANSLFSIFYKIKTISNASPHQIFDNSLVSDIITFIEQNYYMEIDMNMICQHMHYSRSYLSRLFTTETGTTIQEFLRHTRIEKSKQLLSTTNLSISEIALSIGIDDSLYFSKLFKKETGVSPKSYRLSKSST